MKKYLISALWLCAAVLLAAAGIGCMLEPENIMSTMADWVGWVMALSGLMQLGVVWCMRNSVFGDRSFFVKAVVSVLVGVFIMCKSFIAGEVLRVLISMMALVDAVSLLGAAWAMNTPKIKGRGWLWLIGLVEMALGVCGFLKPEILNVAVSTVMGVSLIYEGLCLTYTWAIGMQWRRLNNP